MKLAFRESIPSGPHHFERVALNIIFVLVIYIHRQLQETIILAAIVITPYLEA